MIWQGALASFANAAGSSAVAPPPGNPPVNIGASPSHVVNVVPGRTNLGEIVRELGSDRATGGFGIPELNRYMPGFQEASYTFQGEIPSKPPIPVSSGTFNVLVVGGIAALAIGAAVLLRR